MRSRPLPDDVRVIPLATHGDARGSFTELFRSHWETGVAPRQWNFVRSAANVLRGVHLHRSHADYLVVLEGDTFVGLRDLRADSPTGGTAAWVRLSGRALSALTIPPGVAHGFYFESPALHVYAVTEYWTPDEEVGCHWADPALGIPWPAREPALSRRDAELPTLAELERAYVGADQRPPAR